MAKVSLRAYNQEIETMIDRGQLDEAVAHCRHILKTFPKHLETYRLLGKTYLEYKRYSEAENIFSRVLAAAPDDFVANVGMSIIRDEANKLDEAIWHMERAYETQPANAAVESELRRLHGRREGVQPPKIRMTRGALAHMYVRGELYPPAIAEIKDVLKEDPGRTDMQVLLARAYYKSGLKNDAAEVASAVLRNNPYCLDANRVLVEIVGADRPESVQMYRQRVVELDPYAAQVTSSVFLSNEVPNMAVTLERLDWNGQPVGMQADWESTQAISLESESNRNQQPDWLRNSFNEPASPPPLTPPDQTQGRSVPTFDAAPPSAPTAPTDEIPDFLRAAGWGASTGAFDESKSAFTAEEPASSAQPLEQGDLPEWVKAMAPPQPAETPAAQEEELPDWINKIGTSVLPGASPSNDQPDWAKQLEQPAAQPAEDQPDWLKQFGDSDTSAPAASQDQPDWLKSFANETETPPPAASTGDLDWLNELGGPSEPVTAETVDTASNAPSTEDFDFLNELTKETEQLAPTMSPKTPAADSLGMSSNEQDDAFAWLENLAAKQGASEGLLTKPEERLQEEPDWIKQVKGADEGQPVGQPPVAEPPVSQPPVAQPPAAPPVGNFEELGKSEQERDDSFAWLENLAAKQGATEGLLTKPDERLQEEPEWIQQAKSLGEQPKEEFTSEPPPQEEKPLIIEPAASLEELGKSEQERDDSFAWLENLAAKQGATEGLLTKPDERLQEEPEWVKQAKDVSTQQPPAPVAEQPSTFEDTAAWLRSLDQEETAPETKAPSFDDTAAWLKNLDEPAEVAAPEPQPTEAAPADDLPAWMQNLEEQTPVDELPIPGTLPEVPKKEEPVIPETPKVQTGGLPGWLRDLDKEEETPKAAPREDLPTWLRDETGEVVAEPTRIEPTRATDWQPVIVKPSEPEPEPIVPQPVAPPPPPVVKAAKEEPKKPAPPKPAREPAVRRVPEPMKSLDPVLGQARSELSRSNIPGALENYGKLIKKARFLEDVIYDLREALYRYPVEVSIWQALGDAYMRANRLQDALDAYTKAEELLR